MVKHPPIEVLPTVPTRKPMQPFAVSLLFSTTYVAICVLYIVFSSSIAAHLARDVDQLQSFETVKGIGFVVVSGLAVFVSLFLLLRRIHRQADQLAIQHQALVASEGRAMAGIFASSIAHDINNVLTVAIGYVELLKPVLVDAGRADAAQAVTKALDDLGVLSKRLTTIGKDGALGRMEELDLEAVVHRVAEFSRAHRTVRACDLRIQTSGLPKVVANETLISRMLVNLIINAAEATGGRGRIDVRVHPEADHVAIEVHDGGTGIPMDLRQTVFEAFFTTKSTGTGLGLLSVKVCAEEHRGAVLVETSDLGGACFRVTIPMGTAAVS